MEVTYLGHAAILVRHAGSSLVMDPWLSDPAYCNAWFHYPPLAFGIDDIQPLDWVWCSHDHPDHFDPRTLASLPRDQKFIVPQFASGKLERDLRAEGFTELVPLEFDEPTELAPGFEVTCVRTDLVWEDSALIVRADGVTLFNMNDCKLGDDLLRELGDRYQPDISFLPFSGAIQFPTCYGYTDDELVSMCHRRQQQHLDWFVQRAELLRTARAVPFAGNFALLERDQVWMNEPSKNNINTPDQAVEALEAKFPGIEGLQMNPGDVWTRDGGLVRHAPAPDYACKMKEILELAASAAPVIDALRKAEPPARESLRDDFARFFGTVAERHPDLCTRINARIVFVADGVNGGSWCLNYTEGLLEITDFSDGDPWNLRVTLPAGLLHRAIDGDLTFDEVMLSFRVRFAENPEFFNRDFWVMLYNADEEFLASYLADPAPKF